MTYGAYRRREEGTWYSVPVLTDGVKKVLSTGDLNRLSYLPHDHEYVCCGPTKTLPAKHTYPRVLHFIVYLQLNCAQFGYGSFAVFVVTIRSLTFHSMGPIQ